MWVHVDPKGGITPPGLPKVLVPPGQLCSFGSSFLRELISLCFLKTAFKASTTAARPSPRTWKRFQTQSRRAGTPAWSQAGITAPRWAAVPPPVDFQPPATPIPPRLAQVLRRLSCTARRHGLYLVANMADLQPCPLETAPSACPPDGRWQFNTNVVFR